MNRRIQWMARVVHFSFILVCISLAVGCGGDENDLDVPPMTTPDATMDMTVPGDVDGGVPSDSDGTVGETDQGFVEMMPDAFLPTGSGTSPGRGELIFTEVHYDPHYGLSDGDAEWLEIYNVTNRELSLEDCTLSDGTDFVALGEYTMMPRSFAVFARSDDRNVNGNLDVAGVFPFALNNLSDRLELKCGAITIDVLAYDLDEGFPRTKGFSASLNPSAMSAEANDLPSNWCYPRSVYLEDPIQWGTPGGQNTGCDEPVDQCRLQTPNVIPSEALGIAGEYRDAVEIFGRVREDGLTDRTTANDAPGLVRGQLGFGARGSNPALDDDWIWIFARPNSNYNANAGGEPSFDEYVATLYVPLPGSYDFAYRFSVDGGRNWTYCDGGESGSADGYDVDEAGQLDAQPPTAPCETESCAVPPRGICEGTIAKSFQRDGTCIVNDIGLAACEFEHEEINCADSGQFCAFGVCYDTQPSPPINGDVIISELMYNPDDPRDDESLTTPRLYEGNAEWIELYNTTLRPINLDGCYLTDYDAQRPQTENPSTLEAIVIPPGGYALVARSDDPEKNGGLTVDGTFSFNLTNSGDTIILRCNNAEIDRVTYDFANGFPSGNAASISLDANALGGTQNDIGGAWCTAQDVYLESPRHLGTPGSANPACPRCVDVVCDAPAPVCDGSSVVSYETGSCLVANFTETCDYPTTTTPCDPDTTCREGTCVSVNTTGPEVGDVFFTEVMYNPDDGLADQTGEWFEVFNGSGRPLWLGGCQVSDGSGVSLLQAVYVEPDDYVLFARDTDEMLNGGLDTDVVFDFSLNNNGDLIELRCGELEIDTFEYGAGFPAARQASLNLDVNAFDAMQNDDPNSWCLSTTVYLDEPEHLGTPGLANLACE